MVLRGRADDSTRDSLTPRGASGGGAAGTCRVRRAGRSCLDPLPKVQLPEPGAVLALLGRLPLQLAPPQDERVEAPVTALPPVWRLSQRERGTRALCRLIAAKSEMDPKRT